MTEKEITLPVSCKTMTKIERIIFQAIEYGAFPLGFLLLFTVFCMIISPINFSGKFIFLVPIGGIFILIGSFVFPYTFMCRKEDA